MFKVFEDSVVKIYTSKTFFTAFDEPGTFRVECSSGYITVGAKDYTTGNVYPLKTIACNSFADVTPEGIASNPTNKWYKLVYGVGVLPEEWIETGMDILYAPRYKSWNVVDENMRNIVGKLAMIIYNSDATRKSIVYMDSIAIHIPNPSSYRFLVEFTSTKSEFTYLDGHRVPVQKKAYILMNEQSCRAYLSSEALQTKYSDSVFVVLKFRRNFFEGVRQRLTQWVDIPGGMYQPVEPGDLEVATAIIRELGLSLTIRSVVLTNTEAEIQCYSDVETIVVILIIALITGIVVSLWILAPAIRELSYAVSDFIRGVTTRMVMEAELEYRRKLLDEIYQKVKSACEPLIENPDQYRECVEKVLNTLISFSQPTTTQSFIELQKELNKLRSEVEKARTNLIFGIVGGALGGFVLSSLISRTEERKEKEKE